MGVEIVMHLWEVDHDYYCSESNYYQNGTGEKFATWSDFVRGYGDSDLDMNLVFRWDWKLPYDDDENQILHPDPYYRDGNLMIFFMGQRKGRFWCVQVQVCQADEPEVIKFLQPRLDHLVKLWRPLMPTDKPEKEKEQNGE